MDVEPDKAVAVFARTFAVTFGGCILPALAIAWFVERFRLQAIAAKANKVEQGRPGAFRPVLVDGSGADGGAGPAAAVARELGSLLDAEEGAEGPGRWAEHTPLQQQQQQQLPPPSPQQQRASRFTPMTPVVEPPGLIHTDSGMLLREVSDFSSSDAGANASSSGAGAGAGAVAERSPEASPMVLGKVTEVDSPPRSQWPSLS